MRRLGLNEFAVLEVETGYVTPCHIPLGASGRPVIVDADGYSIIARTDDRGAKHRFRAHRIRYEALHGQLADGLVPDHLCRHRPCCNPAHMEAVTNAENVRRGSCAKLTPEKAIQIRAMRQSGMSCRAIASMMGVSEAVVSRTSRGENWVAGPTPAWERVKARRAKARVEQ